MLNRHSSKTVLQSIRQLDYVILLCEDIPPMKQFYRDVMRLAIYSESADWVEFRAGSTLLALRRRGREYDGPSGKPESASVQLAFRVSPSDVDRCYNELERAGVVILDTPKDQEWGHRTLFFRDPEANVLEIYADL